MWVSCTRPRLGESVSEGTVTRWLKQEGDQVEADEPLLEVSTDKVDTEIPSPAAGVLKAIKVGEDETVEVGSELAVIDDGAGGGDAESGAGDEAAQSDQQETQDQGTDEQADEQPAQQNASPDGQARSRDGAAESVDEQEEPERTPEDDGSDEGESAASADEREKVAQDAKD